MASEFEACSARDPLGHVPISIGPCTHVATGMEINACDFCGHHIVYDGLVGAWRDAKPMRPSEARSDGDQR